MTSRKHETAERTARLDTWGTTASLLCAIHCAAMPSLVTLLPLIGLAALADGWVEWSLIGLSAALGTTSLCLGFREHRSRQALGVLGAGLALVALGRILEARHAGAWGIPLLVAGGLTIAAAHLLNRRLCASCRRCAMR